MAHGLIYINLHKFIFTEKGRHPRIQSHHFIFFQPI